MGLDSGDVNLYGYGQQNPLNRIDPFGMASWTEVEKGTLFYTWHMGWIDEYHAYKNLGGPSLIEAWERIKKARDDEQIGFKLQQFGTAASSEGYFCLQVAPKNPNNPSNPFINRKNQLLHAWMVITDRFEKAQGKWYADWKSVNEIAGLVLKHNIGQQPSAFSSEDLISNLIFFYAVIDHKTEPTVKDVERMADTLVTKYAGRFSEEDELIISKALWLFGFKTRPGHTIWMDPKYFNYNQFLQLSFIFPGGILGDTTVNPSQIGTQAQQLLRKYMGTFGYEIPPRFPDHFRTYQATSEGYLSITGKNTWNFPGPDPKVEYW